MSIPRPSCGLNDEELEEGPSRTRPNCDLKDEESCPTCGLCGAGESSNTRPSGALPLFNVKSSSSSVFNRV